MIVCKWCGVPATGTAWMAYHTRNAIIQAIPCCECHAATIQLYNPEHRPVGYIPNVIVQYPWHLDRIATTVFEHSIRLDKKL